MNFNESSPIFIQIADLICKRVLEGAYLPDQRIPSVRELAVEVEVNPNTVMRSYERLQQNEIIYNKRGVGYFISPNARQVILKERKWVFLQEELPKLFEEMDLLEVGFEQLAHAYSVYKSN